LVKKSAIHLLNKKKNYLNGNFGCFYLLFQMMEQNSASAFCSDSGKNKKRLPVGGGFFDSPV